MPIYPAADWLAGAHANLRLACAMGVGLRLSTPLIATLIGNLGVFSNPSTGFFF
jgi:hypothetical protein